MLPTIRQLQYLVALEKYQSFSRAASHCFVTQSTLSAGIKELETVLGTELATRSKKIVKLTPAGQEFVRDARAIIQQAEKMTQRARRFQEPMSGPLRLGIIPTIAPYVLPDLLPRLEKQYPLLELQLYEDLTERLIDALHDGQIDIAMMAFPYRTPGLKQVILYEEPFYLACPKKSAPKGRDIHTKDLESDSLLLLEDGHCLREHALSACELPEQGRFQTFRASSLPTLIEMVEHGYGMTLLPEMAVAQKSLPPGVAIIPFRKPKPTREIGLAWKSSNPGQSDFESLASWLRQQSQT